MFTFKRLFASRQPAPPAPVPPVSAVPTPPLPEDDTDAMTYPPPRKGLPACSVDDILARQADLIQRLEYGMGCTQEVFEGLVRPVIRRFAAFVHLLPASEVHHHRGPGGLLQHSLEVAWLAAPSSARHVFCHDRPPNERYHIEPRWRVAAGIAGLLHDLGKPVGDLAVGALDGKLFWSPYREPLADWLVGRGMARYYLHWRDTRRHNQHELMAGQVVNLVLTEALLDYFDRDAEIHPAVLGVITGTARKTALLASLVGEADQASVAADLKEHRYDPNALSLGVPVDRYLIDAMRRLAKRGLWTCNMPGSRLWLLPDGLHVVWPQGGEEIIAELDGDNIPGIPKMHETIADILVDRGHVVSWQEGGRTRFYRKVAPLPLVREGKPVPLTTLLLANPDLVYPGQPPSPVGIWSEGGPVRVSAGSSPGRRVFDPPAEDDLRGEAAGEGAPAAPLAAVDSQATVPTVAEPAAGAPIRPTDPAAPARAWLAKCGAAGRILLALAEAIREGRRPATHAVAHADNRLLPYPEALTALAVDGRAADPQALRLALWEGNLIQVDHQRPLLKLQEIDGRPWVVLTPEASAALGALLGSCATDGIQPPVHPPAVSAPAPAPPLDQPSAPAAAAALKPKRRIAEIIALCDAGEVATLQVPEGRLITWEVLATLASERGVAVTKLEGWLLWDDRIREHPNGLVLMATGEP